MKRIHTRKKQMTLFLNKDPRIRGNVFPLTGDGVRTKNAVDNGSPVLWTDGDGPVARIRPEEFSF